MGDFLRVVNVLQEKAEEAEKGTTNIDNRFEAVFSRYSSRNQHVRARSLTFGHFLEGSFQDVFCDLSKC